MFLSDQVICHIKASVTHPHLWGCGNCLCSRRGILHTATGAIPQMHRGHCLKSGALHVTECSAVVNRTCVCPVHHTHLPCLHWENKHPAKVNSMDYNTVQAQQWIPRQTQTRFSRPDQTWAFQQQGQSARSQHPTEIISPGF